MNIYGRRMLTDKRTLNEMWAEYGVYFQPGHVNVKDRIRRMNTYLESGRLKIFDTCENLLRELPDYKYKPQKLGQPTKEEPVDKNNHSIDALQWILMKLPEDPSKLLLGAWDGMGNSLLDNEREEKSVCPQLEDTPKDDAVCAWDFYG